MVRGSHNPLPVIWVHFWQVIQGKPSRFQRLIVGRVRVAGDERTAEGVVQVLRPVAVGMNRFCSHVHPYQLFDRAPDTGFFQHLPSGRIRRVLARVNDACDRRPTSVVRTQNEQYLVLPENYRSYPGQPEQIVADACS